MGPAPGQGGVTSGLGRGCAGGLPLHPTAGGGCGAPRNFLPPPRRTTSCFHRALCTSWVASAPSFPRQPRCIRRRARGQGAPRRPSQAARSSTEGWPGPCPPCHPVPAPHSRCLAPHQFQAWGPSHGAGAPPGHTTWPTSSSLATSALTEPLTQPQHPAVLPCIVCCSPCHAPRSPSTPAPHRARPQRRQRCRRALSPRAGAQGQQQQLSGADSGRWAALGRFPLEKAATHAHPALERDCSKGIAPAGLEAGGVRGWGRMGLGPTALCAPPGSAEGSPALPAPWGAPRTQPSCRSRACGGLSPAARGGGETSGTLRAADGRSHMEPEPRALPWGRGRCGKRRARGTYLPWRPPRGTGRPGSWRRRAR